MGVSTFLSAVLLLSFVGCGMAVTTQSQEGSSLQSVYDKCPSLTNCRTCIENQFCGWCAIEGKCVGGTVTGSNAANCTVWDYGFCTGEACSSHQTCNDCLKDTFCGWCNSFTENKCTEGSIEGDAIFGKCGENQWDKLTCSVSQTPQTERKKPAVMIEPTAKAKACTKTSTAQGNACLDEPAKPADVAPAVAAAAPAAASAPVTAPAASNSGSGSGAGVASAPAVSAGSSTGSDGFKPAVVAAAGGGSAAAAPCSADHPCGSAAAAAPTTAGSGFAAPAATAAAPTYTTEVDVISGSGSGSGSGSVASSL